jgi:hypothetical protein
MCNSFKTKKMIHYIVLHYLTDGDVSEHESRWIVAGYDILLSWWETEVGKNKITACCVL